MSTPTAHRQPISNPSFRIAATMLGALTVLAACPPIDPPDDQPSAPGEACNLSAPGDGCDSSSVCLSGTCETGPTSGWSYTLGASCRALLANADPGHFRSCGTGGAGAQPPRLPAELPCVRDGYVSAAVQHCWAAECYGQLGHPSQAAARERDAEAQLRNADLLCSDAIALGNGACATFAIHGCR